MPRLGVFDPILHPLSYWAGAKHPAEFAGVPLPDAPVARGPSPNILDYTPGFTIPPTVTRTPVLEAAEGKPISTTFDPFGAVKPFQGVGTAVTMKDWLFPFALTVGGLYAVGTILKTKQRKIKSKRSRRR